MTETTVTPALLLKKRIIRMWLSIKNIGKIDILNYSDLTDKYGDCPHKVFNKLRELDDEWLPAVIYDCRNNSGEEVEKDWSRNYKAIFRAAKLEGEWIGWWNIIDDFGREINDFEWIDKAYFIDLVEEREVTKIERIFYFK